MQFRRRTDQHVGVLQQLVELPHPVASASAILAQVPNVQTRLFADLGRVSIRLNLSTQDRRDKTSGS